MNIAVLAGGISTEREVSIISGTGVCKALLFAPATFTVAAWATTSFVTGLPGIAIQLVLLPTLVVALTKARLLRVRYA